MGFFKVRLKDGVITSVEPDDTIHPTLPREDEDWDLIKKGLLRIVGNGSCASRTYSYRYYLYRPERLLYPLKRVGPRGDPHAKFVRISWDEALTIIANKMKEVKEKYGPYSIAGWYTSPFRIAAYIGAGCEGWGIASNESHNFAYQYTFGTTDDHEIQDIFNTKLILIWGADPTNTNLYADAIAYYIKLAKEKGIPVICIDPRFTKAAATLADQWIPIRPGTDVAMMLAMANVLFKENLYNKEYVDKFVEPKGFAIWRNYVLGASDGVDKTPEWAEKICGVPAETIRELARLYAKSKPTWLIFSWCPARQYRGENPARAAMYLQSIMGYVGVPGGQPSIRQGGASIYRAVPTPTSSCLTYGGPMGIPPPGMFGNKPPDYKIPVLFKNYKWADAVLLREKFDKGEISKEEYHAMIGNPMDNPTPNIKFVWFHTNLINQTNNIKKQIEAIKKLEFCVVSNWHMDQPTALLADIVLPRAEVFFEDFFFAHTQANAWAYAPKLIKPPGEVKSMLWIMVQLAKKLGVIDKFAPELANVSDEDWDRVMEEYAKKSYEEWVKSTGKTMPPWEEFKKKPIYREPTDTPHVAFAAQIQKGERFPTPSGKIEFYSEYLATTDLTKTKYGGPIAPYAVYEDIKVVGVEFVLQLLSV
jgi:anaerobic dimethyl sulfoxide reductase subunit A